ncbi:MAG: hypothetical protein ACOCQR_02510 [bacterium]
MKYKLNKRCRLKLRLKGWRYISRGYWKLEFEDEEGGIFIWETHKSNKTLEILGNPSKRGKWHIIEMRIIDYWQGEYYINYCKLK